jgi:hypothetical protein
MKSPTQYTCRVINLGSVLLLAVFIFISCSSQTAQRAGQGAAGGAVVGAVGGMVSALVFGGDVADAAARGAVWGGATGATAGAMSGAVADSNRKKAQQAAELEALKKEIGDDAFNGLAALVDCKHEVAQGYGRTAAGSSNANYSLAGLWLQVLAYKDAGQNDQAQALLPDIVAKDDKYSSESQVETTAQNAMQKLGDIRQEYKLPRKCS